MKKTGTLAIFFLLLTGITFIPMLWEGALADTLNDFETDVSEGLPSDGDYNAIAVGDFNDDENIDMAFGGEDYGGADTTGLYAYAGNGEGSWTSVSDGLPTQDSWGGTALGDADGDGKMELYAGNEGWGSDSGAIKGVGAWEYSGGSWSTSGISSPHPTRTVNDLKLLDFTKGPGLDIALTTSTGGDGGIRVYYGSGSDPITWTSNSVGLPTSGEYSGIDVGDLNDNDLKDIATVGYGAGGLHIYTQNDGGNGWTDRSSTLPDNAKSGRMISVAISDLNNDGDMDIIYGKSDNGGLLVLLGNGGGSPGGTDFVWVEADDALPSSAQGGRFGQIQLADIDKDGDLDLLAAKSNSGLRLYLGNGSEEPGDHVAFTEVTGKGLPTSGTFYGATYLDLDDDDDLDVAGATWGRGVEVYGTSLDSDDLKPVADAGGDQELLTGEEVELDGSGSFDPEDGGVSSFEWTPDAGNPEDVTLSDSSAERPEFTAPNTPGDYEFILRVKDSKDQWSDPDSVIVHVLNRAPVADAGDDQDAYTEDSVTLNGSRSHDPEDGENVNYEWNVSSGNPSEITLSDCYVVDPSFIAPEAHGDYVFTLRVKDSHDEWSEEDEVVVHVLNQPPLADAGVDITRTVDSHITLNGSRSEDPDGTVEHYNWSCTSHTITLDSADSPTPSFTPDEEGTYVLTLRVQDNDGNWSEREDVVNVTVVPKGENLAPSGDAGPDQTVTLGKVVVLDGSGSEDPDGVIVSWEWASTSHTVSLENGNSSSPSFTPDTIGIYTLTLRVKDNNETWSAEDYVNITVEAAPIPPTADAGEDTEAHVGSTASLDGSGSNDPDGFITDYNWTCTSHTVTLDLSGSQASPSFTPEEEGTYVFTLAVRDNDGLWSEEALVNITAVMPPKENSAPVVEMIYPSGGESLSGDVTIRWTAYDPDGDDMLFTIEISKDSGATYTTLKEDFTVTVREQLWETDSSSYPNGEHYRIRVTATDTNASAKSTTIETGDFTVYNEGTGDAPPDDGDDTGFLPGFGLMVLVGVVVACSGICTRRKRRR